MDAYKKIVNENKLYPSEVIEKMAGESGVDLPGEREIMLFHITVCMLLCNQEEYVSSRKRKGRTLTDIDVEKREESKRPRRTPSVASDIQMPSTSHQPNVPYVELHAKYNFCPKDSVGRMGDKRKSDEIMGYRGLEE
ncbi:hypothetical protein ACJJTC_004126 [Scirpophaga incertulas]